MESSDRSSHFPEPPVWIKVTTELSAALSHQGEANEKMKLPKATK